MRGAGRSLGRYSRLQWVALFTLVLFLGLLLASPKSFALAEEEGEDTERELANTDTGLAGTEDNEEETDVSERKAGYTETGLTATGQNDDAEEEPDDPKRKPGYTRTARTGTVRDTDDTEEETEAPQRKPGYTETGVSQTEPNDDADEEPTPDRKPGYTETGLTETGHNKEEPETAERKPGYTDTSPGYTKEDPLVKYRRVKGKGGWATPFMRTLHFHMDSLPDKCARLAPGFDADIIRKRDSFRRIRRLGQIQELQEAGPTEEGQRILVVAPRFGLGNSLRNWVSAFFFGMISGRRIVLLHGGKYHGVFTSLCLAFKCNFDHVFPTRTVGMTGGGPGRATQDASVRLLKVLENDIRPRQVSQRNAKEALYWSDPVLFSYSYAFWDHWWLNNRSLSRCACAAIGGCTGGGGHRSKALHALIGKGPTVALDETIESVLRRHQPHPSRLVLLPEKPGQEEEELEREGDGGVNREEGQPKRSLLPSKLNSLAVAMVALWSEELQPASSGVAMQFDVGFHIRTRTNVLEKPGQCKRECEEKKLEEVRNMEERYLGQSTWKCIGLFLKWIAGLKGPENVRPLSIFLATDNEMFRPEFVRRLSSYGVVYYNGAQVAHVGVSGAEDRGRLPTMAEFFLLGKSHVVVELDTYMSTFSYFSGLMGNGTLLNLPYDTTDMTRCVKRRAAQTGVWKREDPRATSNGIFKIQD